MKIIKKDSEVGTDIILEENEKELYFAFGGNGDLYWFIHNKDINEENYKKDCFEITKENYPVYSLFERLYSDIENINIFEDYSVNTDEFRLYNRSNYKELFNEDNKTITWYSDEENHEVANILRIKKEEDKFKVEFNTQEHSDEYDGSFTNQRYISIRFRNSGSQYDPFNIVFNRMYDGLAEIDDVNDFGHQFHLEECLYRSKIKKLTKNL